LDDSNAPKSPTSLNLGRPVQIALRGGSDADHAAALEWCSIFMREAIASFSRAT
jgi:hypothetical protein